ncbi:MAG: exosortase A [Deferrisomatales bacterium]
MIVVRRLAAPSGARYGWPAALASLVAAFVALLFLYRPGVDALLAIWDTTTYQHGTLILPISLYLAWRNRHRAAALQPRPSPLGLALLGFLGALWVLGRVADVTTAQTFVVVALLPALVVTLLGPGVARAFLFPLAYLFFAWPVGDSIIPILRDYTAWATVLLVRLSGVPVFVEGLRFQLPQASFSVIEACSGIRYLLAALALGVVYAYVSYQSLWRRLAFVASAVVLSLVANAVRAYVLVMATAFVDPGFGRGPGHIFLGWAVFAGLILTLFLGGRLLGGEAPDRSSPGTPLLGGDAVRWARVLPVLLLAGALLAAPPFGEQHLTQRAVQAGRDTIPLPPQVAGWQGPQESPDPWSPDFRSPHHRRHVRYEGPAGPVDLHLLHYRNHGRGEKLITSSNRIVAGEAAYHRVAESQRSVPAPDGGEERRVRETVIRAPGGGMLVVWHWYQVGLEETVQPVVVKLLETRATLTADPRGSLLVALHVRGHEPLQDLRRRLHDFAAAQRGPVAFVRQDELPGSLSLRGARER